MTPTTRRLRPHLLILATAAVIGLAIAIGAGLSIATGAGFIMDDGDYYAFLGLAAAGLTIAFTAVAVLLGRIVRPASPAFWRLAALLGITACAGLASGSCAVWGADDSDTAIAVGLGAAALALLITVAVIKIIADRGVVRFYALAGIAAYPAGWLTALAWHAGEGFSNPLWYASPLWYVSIVFVMPAAAFAATRVWRQYHISPFTAVAIGCWAALAIFLAALAFAWGFHANSYICPILDWGGRPCQSHLNAVVFTLIAGGVPPTLAAGAAWIATAGVGQRQADPPS